MNAILSSANDKILYCTGTWLPGAEEAELDEGNSVQEGEEPCLKEET